VQAPPLQSVLSAAHTVHSDGRALHVRVRPAGACIDGSVLTSCVSGWGTANALAVRVASSVPSDGAASDFVRSDHMASAAPFQEAHVSTAMPIAVPTIEHTVVPTVVRVELAINHPWSNTNEPPFEVTVGGSHDSAGSRCAADAALRPSTDAAPWQRFECTEGVPAPRPAPRETIANAASDSTPKGAAGATWVIVRQAASAAAGRLFVSEVLVFVLAPSPPPATPPPPPTAHAHTSPAQPPPSPPLGRDGAARAIERRFRHGAPSNDLASAGVRAGIPGSHVVHALSHAAPTIHLSAECSLTVVVHGAGAGACVGQHGAVERALMERAAWGLPRGPR
jgi:hypothetical protein